MSLLQAMEELCEAEIAEHGAGEADLRLPMDRYRRLYWNLS